MIKIGGTTKDIKSYFAKIRRPQTSLKISIIIPSQNVKIIDLIQALSSHHLTTITHGSNHLHSNSLTKIILEAVITRIDITEISIIQKLITISSIIIISTTTNLIITTRKSIHVTNVARKRSIKAKKIGSIVIHIN